MNRRWPLLAMTSGQLPRERTISGASDMRMRRKP